MKKIFLFCSLLACVAAFSQGPIHFTVTKHSFGKIKQNVPVSYLFSFKNVSSKPLVIENVEADCGCTKPEFPKEPIAPGKEGAIKVTYNAAALFSFTKNVRVKLATEQLPITLTIEGEVLAPPPGHTK
jgi:hypothetical protein